MDFFKIVTFFVFIGLVGYGGYHYAKNVECKPIIEGLQNQLATSDSVAKENASLKSELEKLTALNRDTIAQREQYERQLNRLNEQLLASQKENERLNTELLKKPKEIVRTVVQQVPQPTIIAPPTPAFSTATATRQDINMMYDIAIQAFTEGARGAAHTHFPSLSSCQWSDSGGGVTLSGDASWKNQFFPVSFTFTKVDGQIQKRSQQIRWPSGFKR